MNSASTKILQFEMTGLKKNHLVVLYETKFHTQLIPMEIFKIFAQCKISSEKIPFNKNHSRILINT
jgi:hypothetical protein